MGHCRKSKRNRRREAAEGNCRKIKETENPADPLTKHLDGRDVDTMFKLLGVEAREGRAASAPKVITGDDAKGLENEKTVQGKRDVKGQAEQKQPARNTAPPNDRGECEGRDSKSRGKIRRLIRRTSSTRKKRGRIAWPGDDRRFSMQ